MNQVNIVMHMNEERVPQGPQNNKKNKAETMNLVGWD
jgi:hypothetical protein